MDHRHHLPLSLAFIVILVLEQPFCVLELASAAGCRGQSDTQRSGRGKSGQCARRLGHLSASLNRNLTEGARLDGFQDLCPQS
ncbi:hypothetical protein IE53DRAFT_167417 [Violaceomyces palustris]|uniref:Uncharacterized protein n=1 Tax=Violaceomyces palustris TaxID=1673888 RepID=A0ACD0NTF5_9BASI|nr:hypothetical protein IE53DRAFT_167417 [Violaceomyces palustris]